MSKQAKTLTAVELRRVLDYVATRKHAARNRAVLLLMYYAGLRVGEAASLRVRVSDKYAPFGSASYSSFFRS